MITTTRTDTTTTEWYADGLRRQESTTVIGHNAGEVTWRWGYDPAGNTTHTWSPSAIAQAANNTAGQPTVMAYSPDGLVTQMTEPVLANGSQHRETGFSHDPLGRVTMEQVSLVGASPASSPAKAYAWTTLGQPKTETGRDGTVQSFEYNAAGQLAAASENAHGASLGAGYYLNGWLRDTETNQPNTPVRHQNFKYWGDGLEAWRSFGQDPNFVQVESIQAYLYNDARALTAASAAGWTFGFDPWNISYDRAGRPITMTDPPNGAAPARTTTLDRNPDGTVVARTLHSGAAGSSVIDQWSYTYDATGRVGSRDRSGAGSVSEVFGYDEAGRLATINAGQVNYDPNGNRLSGPGMPTLTFRADNSIATGPGPTGSGSEAYQYAPWGGLTRDACRSYTYDGFDRSQTTNVRLDAIELLPRCNLVEELLEANDEKRYDPLGRNIWARHDRLSLAGIPVSTQYLNLHHVGLDQELLYEQVVGAANRSGRYVNTPDGTPLAVIDNNNDREFLHRDGQGDTVLAINDAGVSQCAPAMDQWGDSDTDCDNPALPASPNHKWYNSARLDTATDTYQWGSRTYNPTTATWQQPDVAALSGAPSQVSIGTDPLVANRYSYVNGDPINYDDPTGHIMEECATGEYVCEPRGSGRPPTPVRRTHPRGLVPESIVSDLLPPGYQDLDVADSGEPPGVTACLFDAFCSDVPLSQAEWEYCRNPLNLDECSVIDEVLESFFGIDVQSSSLRDIREMADAFQEEYAGSLGLDVEDGNQANAAKHIYWAALLTFKFGESAARGYLDRHENIVGDSARGGLFPDRSVDIINNEIGIEIGTRAREEFPCRGRTCRDIRGVGSCQYPTTEYRDSSRNRSLTPKVRMGDLYGSDEVPMMTSRTPTSRSVRRRNALLLVAISLGSYVVGWQFPLVSSSKVPTHELCLSSGEIEYLPIENRSACERADVYCFDADARQVTSGLCPTD